ncbi:MAG: VWA domain-containing protein [Gammaproteobacteria bacterium]|jgi:Ca-activated chloride channel family protein
MAELLTAFHFSEPGWLWALLLCAPVAGWLLLFRHLTGNNDRIQQYADAHLMPHLLGRSTASSRTQWQRYARWAGLWTLLVLAMAGPRWGFTDVQLFRPGTNLLILMDISRSMQVADVRPSRLARARQEVEDLLNENRGVRVGLIGFASVAHVVSPVTEDMKGIHRVLSAMDTSLVRLQGSRMLYALERAEQLLAGQPTESVNSILIITDGDFEEPGLEQKFKELAAAGIRVHVLGVGTPEGDAVPGEGREGPWIMNRTGQPVISSLNESLLKSLAKAGNGLYQRADYRERDTGKILAEVKAQALPGSDQSERTRVWNERFYVLAGLALLLMLPLFRRTLSGNRL